MKKYDCVGLGIIVLDHLISVENYPVSNSKNIITSHKQQGGGPVPTALAVLGLLGKSTSLMAKLDDDYQADYLLSELHDFGVNTDFVVHDATIDTPEAFVIVDAKGDRTVLLNRRQEADLRPQDISSDLIKHSSILHLDGQEIEAALFAAQIAHENHVTVSIDIGSDRYIPSKLLELVDIAIVSEAFSSAQLVKNNPLKSAEKLLSLGPKIGGVTCGERGSYFASISEESFHQPALPVTVVDSTGAGDVFHGAAIFGFLQKYTLRHMVQFASAAAALSCTKIGGKAGIAKLNEIADFLKMNNINSDFINGG